MSSESFRNVFITGMPGSGKTTLGKLLAKKLDLKYVDTDQLIEALTGKKISEIFLEHGELFFRNLEKKILKEIVEDKEKKIISLGGGTPCNEENLNLIKSTGFMIYLQLTPKALTSRISQNPEVRPMFTGMNPDEITDKVSGLLAEREKYYSKADLIVRGLNADHHELFQKIKSIVHHTSV